MFRPVYAHGMEMLDICYSSQLLFDHSIKIKEHASSSIHLLRAYHLAGTICGV